MRSGVFESVSLVIKQLPRCGSNLPDTINVRLQPAERVIGLSVMDA
jgi:hypothetical protein